MKIGFTVLFLLLLAGCGGKSGSKHILVEKTDYYIDVAYPTNNQNERVRFLVFHYTAANDDLSLRLLTRGSVSSHYLIPSILQTKYDEPVILQLVSEEKRSWHAGLSEWYGRTNLNDTSIGVEIVNMGFTDGPAGRLWYPYSEQQIDALIRLSKDIINRYGITPDNVVGHSDIAPTRKYDPGVLFPWKRLAEQGIGAWPDDMTVDKYLAGRHPASLVDVARIQQALSTYGYKIPKTGILDEDTRKVISAFQMHFRPQNILGEPDAQTEAIALALVEKYRS